MVARWLLGVAMALLCGCYGVAMVLVGGCYGLCKINKLYTFHIKYVENVMLVVTSITSP